MSKPSIITGLDIGTTKVAVAVGTVQEGVVHLIALSHTTNHGMRQGVIVDVEDTAASVTAALEEAERMAGTAITNAFISINGKHITTLNAKGVIAVSRADGEITQNDIDRVIEAARAVALPPNREIIHSMPRAFIVDGQEETFKDPLGMRGIRLEVDAIVVGGATNAIKNLMRAVNLAGVEINDIIFSPLATGRAILSKSQKESGVIMIDIGAASTNYVVYEEGDILLTGVLPVGSAHLTNDLAIGLRTNLDVAEKIKVKFGHAIPEMIKESEVIDLSRYDKKETSKVTRRFVAEIIQARLNEMFSMITEDLRAISRDGSLPAGVVFTGGGCQLEGLIELAKESLRLPAEVGTPGMDITGMIDKLDNPIYCTSIGLMLTGLDTGSVSNHTRVDTSAITGVLDKAKGLLKQFLP